ncbi:hypothetical protein [Pleionea sp. CnH1-48]|uniref:hypothetical protein n=1 Tax=Pleionea sp. CnH1-48 TaxID=2954494 RepID=UPI002097107D|nr:hypothetical protein [Pleionea sp. CnH1-48]MCO7224395.1 hypothetical protein [Pleionea sp. CnH1-48]
MKLLIPVALLASTLSYSNEVIHFDKVTSGEVNTLPGFNGDFVSIDGENLYGPVVTDGSDAWALTNYSANTWTKLVDGIGQVSNIREITGDNRKGPIITSGFNIYYWTDRDGDFYDNRWDFHAGNPCTSSGFNSSIISMTGDQTYGVAVLCGDYNAHSGSQSGNAVMYEKIYSNDSRHKSWHSVPSTGLQHSLWQVSGDNLHGLVGYSNKSVYYIENFSSSGSWTRLPDHRTKIVSISGDNMSGPVILDCSGKMYKINSYANPQWQYVGKVNYSSNNPALCDSTTYAKKRIAGDNRRNPIVAGPDVSKASSSGGGGTGGGSGGGVIIR